MTAIALRNYAREYLKKESPDDPCERYESEWERSESVLRDFINFVNTKTDPEIIAARKKIAEKEAEAKQLQKGLRELENKFEL